MAEIFKVVAPSGGDYTSLSAWEAGEQTNLVAAGDTHVVEIQGDWSGGADTSAVVVSGWTTDSTHDITIRTDAANRAGAKWDASKYVLNVPDSSTAGIAIYSAHLRLVGVQVLLESTTSSTQYGVRTLTGSGHVFVADGCYFRGTVNGGTGAIVGIGSNNSNAYNLVTTRCIYKDCNNGSTFSYGIDFTKVPYTGNHVAYSNTIYGCFFGIRSNSAGASLIKNNLVAAGTSSSGVYDFHDTFATGSDYNATTSTDTVGTGSNNISSATVAFRDAANHDLHITNGSTSIIDAGTDLSADATWPLAAVDIDGKARATWDIGAAEWYPVEVVSIVAPSGGDYTSLSTWESGEQTDLVTADQTHVAEIRGDWSGGPDTVGVTVSGWTMDSDHRVIIRTDSSNRATAAWDTTRYALQSAGAQCVNIQSGSWVNIDGLQIRNTRNSTFTRTIFLNQGTGVEVNISNCFIVGDYAQAGNALIFNNYVSGGDQVTNAWNTILTYIDLQSSNGMGVYVQTTGGFYYNCLAYNTDDGFKRNGGTSYVKNCIAANNPNSGFYNWLAGSDYNTSSDATAPGANSQINVTPTFVDPANLDFRLSPYDTIAQGNGASLYADGITTDIEGTSRGTASATAFDIGPHHQTQATRTIEPSGGSYTSLAAWESGEQQDLVANNKSATAEAAGNWSGGADTGGCILTGWTTDSTHKITIRTDAANKAGASWDATKYVLNPNRTGSNGALENNTGYVDVIGLQILGKATGNNYHIGILRTYGLLYGDMTIDGCFIRRDPISSGTPNYAAGIYINSRFSLNTIRNCIVEGYSVNSALGAETFGIWMPAPNSGGGVDCFNNTVYGCYNGINLGASVLLRVKNCIAANSVSADYTDSGNLHTDYNTSSDATAVGANSQTNVTPTFANAAGLDFSLSPYDTVAQGNGTSLYAEGVTTDIDGTSRGTASATAYDIGAHHQTQTTRTIKPSGGDYTSLGAWEAAEQSDLVANNKSHTAEAAGDWSASTSAGVTIAGWTSDSTHRITVTTDSANRASAEYDPTKFVTGFISVYVDHTLVYGVQVRRNTTALLIAQAGTTNITFSRCFLYYNGTSSTGLIIQLYGTLGLAVNCSIWGSDPAYGRGIVGSTGVNYAYNCSMYGVNMGYRRTSGTFRAVNCLYDNIGFNSFSSETTCYGAAGYTTGTVPFVDPTNTTAPDFHLASSDANIVGAATDMTSDPVWGFYGYTEDADGDTRSSWDIGADEYTAGSGTVHALAGDMVTVSGLAGALSSSFQTAGGIVGQATLAGALTVTTTHAIAGGIVGQSTLAGALTVTTTHALAGDMVTVSGLAGALTVTTAHAIAGGIVGQATLAGALTVTIGLAGSVSGVSTFFGLLTGGSPTPPTPSTGGSRVRNMTLARRRGMHRAIGVVVAPTPPAPAGYPVFPGTWTVDGGLDPFDDYAEDAPVTGLDGGYTFVDQTWTWDGAWVARDRVLPADYGFESFNSYATSSSVDGLSEGTNWAGAWVARDRAIPSDYGFESFNSYATSSSVDGLSEGTNWAGAWVAR